MSRAEGKREPILTLRADLYEQEHVDKFLEVKRHYMLQNNTDVIRSLIRDKYDELQKEKEEREKTVDLSLKEKS